MGEDAKQTQEEEPKAAAAEAKPEEKKEEEKPPEAAAAPEEEKKEEPKLPSPFVLYVDLHCVGCARKIEKSIMKIRGVEGVVMDMALNQVTIKGIVEPQAVCNRITKKTKRKAKVLSPLPEAEGEPKPQVVTSQVSGSTTVELNVNMHCEACAEQLKRKILKMKGVQTAATELSTGKVIVTGTMDANKLADYVYKRTKKQARIVPQPEPVPVPEPAEAKKQEEKKEGENPAPEGGKNKEEEKPAGPAADQEPKKEENGAGGDGNNNGDNKDEAAAKKQEEAENINSHVSNVMNVDEESMKRMMMYYYQHQPLYMIELIPPPQLFSDENPNACCIS